MMLPLKIFTCPSRRDRRLDVNHHETAPMAAIASAPHSLPDADQEQSGALSTFRGAISYATFAIKVSLRDRTVIWLGILFMAMVCVSAYLGWTATRTVDKIYDQAAIALQAEGKEIPPNPVQEISPLSMLRNLTTYIALLGALVAIVLGGHLITQDRKSGVFPLIASRAVPRIAYALGKISALAAAIVGVLAVAALVNAIAILVLPSAPVTADTWLRLCAFYGISALYLFTFGLMAMASAAWARSESMGLLIPVTVWLAMTFVLPQLSANINPMAALNPISSLTGAPSGSFFETAGPLLAPLSLTSTYREIAASILGILPVGLEGLGVMSRTLTLVAADLLMGATAVSCILLLDATRSDVDE
jgi:ABC-type transport system involved in multi-copper enzyme maturation permease subunit